MNNGYIKVKEMNNQLSYKGFIYASDAYKHYYGEENLVKVLIDEIDFYKCSNRGWYINKKGYVYTVIKGKTMQLHRYILNLEDFDGENTVDHFDGNKLNNRRSNLNIISNRDNVLRAWYEQNKHSKGIKIAMYNKEDINYLNPIMEFMNAIEAEKYLINNNIKANRSNIGEVARGNRKTASGYRWRYVQ